MAHGEATSDGPGKAAEVPPHALTDRLQGFEAGGVGVGMDTDAFGGAMINCDEHRRQAFAGDRSG